MEIGDGRLLETEEFGGLLRHGAILFCSVCISN